MVQQSTKVRIRRFPIWAYDPERTHHLSRPAYHRGREPFEPIPVPVTGTGAGAGTTTGVAVSGFGATQLPDGFRLASRLASATSGLLPVGMYPMAARVSLPSGARVHTTTPQLGTFFVRSAAASSGAHAPSDKNSANVERRKCEWLTTTTVECSDDCN